MATPSPIRLELDDHGLAPAKRGVPLRRQRMQWAERLLLLIGVICVGYFLYVHVEARLYQNFEDRELDQILNSANTVGTSATRSDDSRERLGPRRVIPDGSVVGRIEVPRLGVSAVIRAGSDARTLRLAVGYIAGTAFPGDRGNVGLAGHRDTFFRKLRDINPDDEIRIVTKEGVFHYSVQRTSIVMPSDVWVLNQTDYPALTLVTCYPFTYIGSAPQRFIVRAALKPSKSERPEASAVQKVTPARTLAPRARSAARAHGVGAASAKIRSTVAKKSLSTSKKTGTIAAHKRTGARRTGRPSRPSDPSARKVQPPGRLRSL
jgi:sortase A